MDGTSIESGTWAVTAGGDLEAPYVVTVGQEQAQPTLVRVEASTVAAVGIPLGDDLGGVLPGLDERARAAIEHLASTGRVSPELRLSTLDLRGVAGGEDPPDDGIHQSGPEA